MNNYENLNLMAIKPKLELYLKNIKTQFNDFITSNKVLSNKINLIEKYLDDKYYDFVNKEQNEKSKNEFLSFINLFTEIYCAYKVNETLSSEAIDFKLGFYEDNNNPDFYFIVDNNTYHIEVTNSKSIKNKIKQIKKFENKYEQDTVLVMLKTLEPEFEKNRLHFSFSSILLNNFNDLEFKKYLLKMISKKSKITVNYFKKIKDLICDLNNSEKFDINFTINQQFVNALYNGDENLYYYKNKFFEIYLDCENNIFCEMDHESKEIYVYKLIENETIQKLKLKYITCKCECCDNFVFNKKEIFVSVFNDEIKFKNVIESYNTNFEDLNQVSIKYFNKLLINNY